MNNNNTSTTETTLSYFSLNDVIDEDSNGDQALTAAAIAIAIATATASTIQSYDNNNNHDPEDVEGLFDTITGGSLMTDDDGNDIYTMNHTGYSSRLYI